MSSRRAGLVAAFYFLPFTFYLLREGAGRESVQWADISAVPELTKKGLQQGVFNRQAEFVWFQVTLRHVGHMLGAIYEDVVPGLVFGRTAFRDLFVPGFGTLKSRINIDDNASVVKKYVVNQLAYRVFAGILYDRLRTNHLSR